MSEPERADSTACKCVGCSNQGSTESYFPPRLEPQGTQHFNSLAGLRRALSPTKAALTTENSDHNQETHYRFEKRKKSRTARKETCCYPSASTAVIDLSCLAPARRTPALLIYLFGLVAGAKLACSVSLPATTVHFRLHSVTSLLPSNFPPLPIINVNIHTAADKVWWPRPSSHLCNLWAWSGTFQP